MRVAVSTIAWAPEDDDRVSEVLRAEGVDAVEVAPTVRWPDVRGVSARDAAEYGRAWRERGLDVVALQSLLFGRPDLQLLGDAQARAGLVAHLEHVLSLGAAMGARCHVFGSPRNRVRGDLPPAVAADLAADVLSELAETAEALGVLLAVEANPPAYGADFLTSAHEAARLVAAVGRPGLRLHLDTACMDLAGDDPVECVQRYVDLVAHVHLSEPGLGPVGGANRTHAEVMCALRACGYDGAVSVEMRRAEPVVETVRRAARHARALVAGVAA